MDSWPTSREIEKPKAHTIWKFPLPTRGRVTLEMPRAAQLLSVDVQKDVPMLWALCCADPSAPKASRVISIHVTGTRVPATVGKFVGTFQINRGDLVGHVFDMGEC